MVLFLSFIPTWCHPQIMQYPQTGRLQLIPNKLYWGLSFMQTFPNTEYSINILSVPRQETVLMFGSSCKPSALVYYTHDCQAEAFLPPAKRCMAYWKTSIKAGLTDECWYTGEINRRKNGTFSGRQSKAVGLLGRRKAYKQF